MQARSEGSEGASEVAPAVPEAPADRWYRDFRVSLGLVVAGGLAIRVASVVLWQRHQSVDGDQVYYHFQARALAEGAGFVNPFVWRETGAEIGTALHPPLYSIYLASWSLLGLDDPTAHKLASTLLGAGVVLVVGLVGRSLAGPRAGLTAAGLAAIYPNLWINDGALAAESIYALLIAVILLLSYRFWFDPTSVNAALLGAAVALAALARAEAVALYVLLVLPLAVVLEGPSRRDKLRLLVVSGVVGGAVLAPWVGRNLLTFEEPAFLSNGAGFVLEIANCDETYSGDHLGYWDTACDRSETWLYDDRNEAAVHETAVERAKRDAGLDYMREHVGEVPMVVAARVGRMWELFRPDQSIDLNTFFERRGRWPSIAGLAMYLVMVPLAMAGLLVLWRRRITMVPFMALAISVTLTAAMSFGITRYRVGMDVAICVLAGVAVTDLWSRRDQRRLEASAAS